MNIQEMIADLKAGWEEIEELERVDSRVTELIGIALERDLTVAESSEISILKAKYVDYVANSGVSGVKKQGLTIH